MGARFLKTATNGQIHGAYVRDMPGNWDKMLATFSLGKDKATDGSFVAEMLGFPRTRISSPMAPLAFGEGNVVVYDLFFGSSKEFKGRVKFAYAGNSEGFVEISYDQRDKVDQLTQRMERAGVIMDRLGFEERRAPVFNPQYTGVAA